MPTLFDVRTTNVPACYRLAWRKDRLLICIAPAPFVELLTQLTPESCFASRAKEQLQLAEFSPPTRPAWGFGQSLRFAEPQHRPHTRHSEDWPVIECRYERILASLISTPGQNGYMQRGYEISGSLQALFQALNAHQPPAMGEFSQQLVIRLTADRQDHASLGADVAALARWQLCHASSVRGALVKSVRAAMSEAYGVLRDRRLVFLEDFRVKLEQGLLNLTCPGNACGLVPECPTSPVATSAEQFVTNERIGYELVPHNTDSPLQQLTLLAGLAQLDEFLWLL
ncbi:MAG: hypothetical protein U0517_02620 [Candidatus Andersenbacteria bacterium]